MSEGELKGILNAKVTNSLGYYGGKLSKARVTALQYYQGEPFGNELDGRSQVVSRDVAEAIDSMMPSLMKIFTAGEDIVRFEPQNPDDEPKAQQATDYVNWIWTQQNNGFKIMYDWFKDALLNRASAIKIWWDEQEDIAKETYKGLTDQEFVYLIEDAQDDELDIVSHEEYPDPDAEIEKLELQPVSALPAPAPPPSPAAPPGSPPAPGMGAPPGISPSPPAGLPAPPGGPPGMPPPQMNGPAPPMPMPPPALPPPPSMLHDVTIRRTNKNGKINIVAIPGEEFLMDRRAVSLEETPFVAHRTKKTISDLVEMGFDYDVVKTLGEGDSSDFNLERLERFRQEDELPYRTGNNYDPSMKEVWINECYLKVDYDGDGIAELRKITFAGESGNFAPGATVILENIEIDAHPFAALTPIPMPHKFYGMSIPDQTMDLQLIKSTLFRTTLDHSYNAIMPQLIVDPTRVNMDDILTRRPSGVVRATGDVNTAVAPMASAQMGVDPFQLIAYIDSVREQRTGVRRFTAGPEADVLKDAYSGTATGATMVENSSQERLELIARCFAEIGVKQAFRIILKLVSMHQHKPKMIRLRDKWVEMDPREWANEFDMVVTVGLGTGNRQQQLQGMQMLMQFDNQIITLQQGINGPLVTGENVYNKLDKICQYLGLKSAEEYYTDPSKHPTAPPPPKPDPIVQAAQIKAQSDQQRLQLETKAKQQQSAVQTQFEVHKFQTETQADAQKMQAEHQLEMQKRQFELQSQERIALAKIANEREVEQARLAIEQQKLHLEHAKAQADIQTKATSTALEGRKVEGAEKSAERDHQLKVKTTSAPKLIKVKQVRGTDKRLVGWERHYDDGSKDNIAIERAPA